MGGFEAPEPRLRFVKHFFSSGSHSEGLKIRTFPTEEVTYASIESWIVHVISCYISSASNGGKSWPKFLIGPLSHEEPRGVSYEDGIVGGEDGHVSNMQRGERSVGRISAERQLSVELTVTVPITYSEVRQRRMSLVVMGSPAYSGQTRRRYFRSIRAPSASIWSGRWYQRPAR